MSNRMVSALTLTLVVLLLCNYGIGNVENIKTKLKTNGTSTSKDLTSEKIQQRKNQNTEVTNYKILLSLTDHEAIEISSDANFSAFPGSGTANDPYIIEGYHITTNADYGIYIHDTTKYFIIRNCHINAEEIGIYIYNVADGTTKIINNTVINSIGRGIYLNSSGYSTVANNTVTDNNQYGIYLEDSSSSTVVNNTVTDNTYGIYLKDSGYSTVANNTVKNNRFGIHLGNSGYSTVANNTVTDNEWKGIWLYYSSYSTVENNTVKNNDQYGIVLSFSGYSTVANNTVKNNNGYGIHLGNSGYSTVANNTFVNDGLYIWLYNLDDYFTLLIENNLVNGKALGYLVNLASAVIDQPNYYGQLFLINCSD
ncbi:MAG: right-handed parallel beta-helix repeat-containing protein, partial [Candidatus Heimdallarchaeaceae archaeon]